MKKLLIILLCLLTLTGCRRSLQEPIGKISDMSGYSIESGQFIDLSVEKALELMNKKTTTIIYCGEDSCPVCKQLVSILNEVSIEKTTKLYYIDFAKHENLQFDLAQQLVERCSEFLEEIDEDGNLKMPLPCIIYIYAGEVMDVHIGTLNRAGIQQADLTDLQKASLKYNLEKEFDVIIGI